MSGSTPPEVMDSTVAPTLGTLPGVPPESVPYRQLSSVRDPDSSRAPTNHRPPVPIPNWVRRLAARRSAP